MTTKADTSVKWFHSEMADAPVLSGQAGKLIELLDACLINGFSTRTPDSIVVSEGVATVSISAGNPYQKHAVVAISGASNAALNAEWRIATSGASSFTFLCPGVADGTVSGATVKRAGAGWGKPFADTNIAAYQSLDPNSTQLYLRVNDTDPRYAFVRGYENMTDANTGTGPFPTITQLASTAFHWHKSEVINTSSRRWFFVADGSFMVFYNTGSNTTQAGPYAMYFGDIDPIYSQDKYHCVISADSAGNSGSPTTNNRGFIVRHYLSNAYFARPISQLGTAQMSGGLELVRGDGNRHLAAQLGPPHGGGVFLRSPVALAEDASALWPVRGFLPGVIEPSWSYFKTADFVPFSGDGVFAGKELIGLPISSGGGIGSVVFDLTGPWR